MIKQTIILTNNINENEKLKSLALFGRYTLNVHYMTPLDLANYLIERSGCLYSQTFISNEDLCAQIYSKIREIDYFRNISFNDVSDLVDSINSLRYHVLSDDQDHIKLIGDLLNKNPVFAKKNEALIDAWFLMSKYLTDNNLIDEIGVIRYAIDNGLTDPDTNFIFYSGSELADLPLVKNLLLAANGKEVSPTEIAPEKIKISSYTKAFGQTNEIENILSYIYKNNIPFDKCLIAAAETKDYSNILINYRDVLGFPVTIGTGTLIIETNPGKFFSLINEWEDNHFHGEYFKFLINDPTFDIEKFKTDSNIPEDFTDINKGLDYSNKVSFESIIQTVADLKMSFNAMVNDERLRQYFGILMSHELKKYNEADTSRRLKEFKCVEGVVDVLNKGRLNFVESYARIVDPILDKNAHQKILQLLSYEKFGVNYEDLKKAIFSKNVGRQSPTPGKLYFTSIKNASSCLRPYLFIVGLSSNNFPGKIKENPFVLDKDYEAFKVEKASYKDIEYNKNCYFSLLREATMNDVNIHLSYAFYNSQSLKEQNASSVIFETYQRETPDIQKTIKDLENEFSSDSDKFKVVEYFENPLLPISEIGKALSENKRVNAPIPPDDSDEEFDDEEYEEDDSEEEEFDSEEEEETEEEKRKVPLKYRGGKRGISASAILDFIKCPFLYYMEYVLKIPQPEEVKIYEIIPANDLGTIVHSLMEHLDVEKTSLPDFLAECEQRFREYFVMHVVDNEALIDSELEDFLEIMTNGYEMTQEDNRPTLLAEVDNGCFHEDTGLLIHGLPDKVVDNGDGTCTVIDYKTGRNVKHNLNKPDTLIQAVVYAYVLKHCFNLEPTAFEFWYLRSGEKIKSTDGKSTMDEHFTNLNEKLKQMKECFDCGDFSPRISECEDCYFKAICPRKPSKNE